MKHHLCLFTRFALGLLLLLPALPARSWGQKGHDTTCTIAQRHLTGEARRQVAELLDGRSMVYWSNWLDNAVHTPQYAYAKTWHYKDIDEGVAFDDALLLPEGDVVRAIEVQYALLKDASAPRSDRQLALKMLIHLVGDLHQPMHLGHATDRGGNNWIVTFFGEKLPLHTIWDTNLLESAHAWSHTEWVEEIDRLNSEDEEAIVAGSVTDWARQTHAITTQVYAGTPQGDSLSYDYVHDWTPVIEQQLLHGGLRLAHLLNSIWPG